MHPVFPAIIPGHIWYLHVSGDLWLLTICHDEQQQEAQCLQHGASLVNVLALTAALLYLPRLSVIKTQKKD